MRRYFFKANCLRRLFTLARSDQVKTLREITGAPLLKCKEALEKFSSFDDAKNFLREKNLILAEKRAGNETSEGLLAIEMTENKIIVAKVNTETDFVAKNEEFINFASQAVKALSKNSQRLNPGLTALNNELLSSIKIENGNLLDRQKQITAKIQENIKVSEVFTDSFESDQKVGIYVHKALKDNIGSALGYVVLKCSGNIEKAVVEQLAEDLAVHVFCKSPSYVSFDKIPTKMINEKKTEIFGSLDENFAKKPKEIQEKIIEGKIRKAFEEEVLMEQFAEFFDPEKTVGEFIKQFESAHKTKVEIVKFNCFKIK